MSTSNVKIGSKVTVKVAKNEINVEIVEILDDGFTVKNPKTQKEFKVREIIKVLDENTPPQKKLSLLNAAVEVLKTKGEPLNTREIIKYAIENELWLPTNSNTPEQTLYGAIFREIATREQPRIIKSSQKGKFEFNTNL